MSVRKVILALGIVGSIIVVALIVVVPNLGAGSHTRPFIGIVNRLRQIEGAKEQYEIEHKVEASAVISREQLLPYLPERFWYRDAEYRINPIGVYPEAILPKRFDGFPAKTIIRFQTNVPGFLIILPKDARD